MFSETRTPAPSRGKLHPDKIRILVRRIDHTSPIIAVVVRVLEAVNRSCSPNELTGIVQTSPELSMKVIRMANSAAFGNRATQSVREAIDYLGWQRVASIVMTVGMREQSEEVAEGGAWDSLAYQKRSVALAFVSQHLAQRIEPWQVEKYYMCGLFQEWGYLVLAQHMPDLLIPIAAVLSKTPVESPIEVERFYIDSDHAELGAIAAEEYGLPSDVIASIRYHHEPASAPPEHQLSADIGHVASWIVGEMGIQLFPNASNHRLDRFALIRLGWSQDDVEGVQQTIFKATQTVSAVLIEG